MKHNIQRPSQNAWNKVLNKCYAFITCLAVCSVQSFAHSPSVLQNNPSKEILLHLFYR